MRLIGTFLLAAAFLAYAALVYASETGNELRKVQNALVTIRTECEYTIYTKQTEKTPVLKLLSYAGNGFFVQNGQEGSHKNITAGHVVQCPLALPNELLGESLTKEDVASFEIKYKVNVLYNGQWHTANVIKLLAGGVLETPDLAVLEVILPRNLTPYHVPLLPDKTEYDVLDEVVIFGKMPFNQEIGWLTRIKRASIEVIDKYFLQLGAASYSGMSGSPVLYFVNGTYHAIAIMTASADGVDISWATRLNREFLNK